MTILSSGLYSVSEFSKKKEKRKKNSRRKTALVYGGALAAGGVLGVGTYLATHRGKSKKSGNTVNKFTPQLKSDLPTRKAAKSAKTKVRRDAFKLADKKEMKSDITAYRKKQWLKKQKELGFSSNFSEFSRKKKRGSKRDRKRKRNRNVALGIGGAAALGAGALWLNKKNRRRVAVRYSVDSKGRRVAVREAFDESPWDRIKQNVKERFKRKR